MVNDGGEEIFVERLGQGSRCGAGDASHKDSWINAIPDERIRAAAELMLELSESEKDVLIGAASMLLQLRKSNG